MMRPDEFKLKASALRTFEEMVETYIRMADISTVSLYYAGHSVTSHIHDGEVSKIVRKALVEHWRSKLILEAANLRSHGIDPSSLMPEEVGKWHD
jgi:hypothetical protein